MLTARAHQFKVAYYDRVGSLLGALTSPRRFELLDLLSQAPRTVDDLARQTRQTVANTSQHLQILRRTALVSRQKTGLFVVYRLADETLPSMLANLRAAAESRLVDISANRQRYAEELGVLNSTGLEELVQRVRQGTVTVVDVRSEAEFLAGHLPGAVSLPMDDVDRKGRLLSRRRTVVAYCRGPYCVMALDAVAVLRRRGFNAVELPLGVAEWRARGLRIERGPVPLQ